MAFYLLKRIGQTALTLLILTFMIFGLARLTGDPAPLILSFDASDSDYEFFRKQYGLDRSLPEQYLTFMGNILQGDFGHSFRYKKPAIDIVVSGIIPTLKLTSLAMLLAIFIGLALGIASAASRNRVLDKAVNFYASIGQAVPSFWFGLVLISVFAVKFPLFPSSGYGSLAHYVLPVVTLALFASASFTRLARANMQEALRSEFIAMEQVLGLSQRRILFKHALRNAAIPIVTYFGLQFGLLMGGAIVTERVFAWPGLGQIVVDAIVQRDYPVVQATVLVTAIMFMLINLLVDVIVMFIDPRLRA